MKRYVNIKKINLNESRVRLVEADPVDPNQANPNQNNTNQAQPNSTTPNNTTPQQNNSQLDAYTKDWTNKMNRIINTGYLDVTNARYKNLFDENNIKQILNTATTPNAQVRDDIKVLIDSIDNLRKKTGGDLDYSEIVPEIIDKARVLLNYYQNLQNNQWFKNFLDKNEAFKSELEVVFNIVKDFDTLLNTFKKNNPNADMKALCAYLQENQNNTKVSLGHWKNLKEVVNELRNFGKGKITSWKEAFSKAKSGSSQISKEEANNIAKTITNFNNVLQKLRRSFAPEALQTPVEQESKISAIFEKEKLPLDLKNIQSQTTKEIAYELIAQELFGKLIRQFNPQKIFYAWEANNVSTKLNELIPYILDKLEKLLASQIFGTTITTIQELQAFIEPMNSIIELYSPIYMVDKSKTDQKLGNAGWAECIVTIRQAVELSKISITNTPTDQATNSNAPKKDWETLIKEAGTDTKKLQEIWNDYFNTEWSDTQEMRSQINLISKAFINELLAYGFTEELNPFIAYLNRHKEWLNKGIWTTEKYNAIHNALIHGLISKEALRGNDVRVDNARPNLINSEHLIVDNNAAMLYEYLEQQGRIFAMYKQTPQFKSDILNVCYSGQLGYFLIDLFYEPGNPVLVAEQIKSSTLTIGGANNDTANSILTEFTNLRNKENAEGIGKISGKLNTLPDIRTRIKQCLENDDDEKSRKFAPDIKDLVKKVGPQNMGQFITYLYITNNSSPEALEAMHEYNINENTTFDVAKSKTFSALIKNININNGNVASVIRQLADEAGLTKVKA